jgi:hypothetical protein
MYILSFEMQIDGVIIVRGMGLGMQVQNPYFMQNTQKDEYIW